MAASSTSLRAAAITSGIALFATVLTAPYAELYVYPRLVAPYQAAETAARIVANKQLFISAIFAYLIAFIGDIVITWGLYILLKPVHKHLSLLTALFRLVYTMIALVALLHLVTVLRLLTTPEYLKVFSAEQLNAQSMLYLRLFRNHWYLGLIFFGIHLAFVGYLVVRSTYIPKILGIILIITGAGYLLTTIRPYLFPAVNVDFAQFTFYGELIFMLWLLIRGYRIPEPVAPS